MPSHIFFALGMWDDAVAANQLSIAVADERVKRKGLGPDQRNYHSLLWLEYAYLQEGRYDDAHRVMADIEQSGYTRPLAMMRAYYAIETGKQDESLSHGEPSRRGVAGNIAALNAYGLVAARNGKLENTRIAFESAKKQLANGSNEGTAESHHGAMPAVAATESPADRKIAEIMEQQLEAELLLADGKKEQGLQLLAKTTAEEDALSFDFGPPVPIKPAHELYGEELLTAGRAKEARDEFQRALARAPNRAQSMRGLAKAAAACGDRATSQQTMDVLKSFWHGEAFSASQSQR
jgi:tetratricopeptide (TPR) repeat protein